MMEQFLNHMRHQAERYHSTIAKTRFGTVDSVNPANYSCKVKIQPEGLLTGWLPIASPWVGNNWGLFCLPMSGDMVDVHFDGGDLEAGYVSQRFYNDEDRPLSVTPGEFWLVHQSGSCLKFHNDGTVELTANAVLTVKAPSIILQNVGTTLKRLCTDVFMTLFNGHTHGGVQGGSSNTNIPNQQAVQGTHTTNIVQAE
ncbi:MAG: phage baseplate assembly protein V [Geobacteraceae bacterium]|nr:phage baseplate assembly protein V [Geobacteraceae bacterium]